MLKSYTLSAVPEGGFFLPTQAYKRTCPSSKNKNKTKPKQKTKTTKNKKTKTKNVLMHRPRQWTVFGIQVSAWVIALRG
jgi:hypothetical protein